MPAVICTCEVCGRKGRAIPCKNFKYCKQGRCPICFVTILESPDAWSKVWSIQLTCESCCHYGSGCLVDADELRSSSSQPSGKVLQQDRSSKVEKRQRLAADGHMPSSKRSKGSPASAKAASKPSPQLRVEQEAAAATKKAAKTAAEPPSVKATAKTPAPKQAGLSATQQPASTKSVAQSTKQQHASKQTLDKTDGKPTVSSAAGTSVGGNSCTAAAAAAALQAKVAASSGAQWPLSGSGMFSKSCTTDTLGVSNRPAQPKVQQPVATSACAGSSLKNNSMSQQRQQQAPGSGSQFAAAARLGQSRPGGSSPRPSSTGEPCKSSSKQHVAHSEHGLHALQPKSGNSKDQLRQPVPAKHQNQQQAFHSRADTYPGVRPQKSDGSSLVKAVATTLQPVAAQPIAHAQQRHKNMQQLEKLREKKQRQLEREQRQQQIQQRQQQRTKKQQERHAQSAVGVSKSEFVDVAPSRPARPASAKQEPKTQVAPAAAGTGLSKPAGRPSATATGEHSTTAAKLANGVDAIGASGLPPQKVDASGSTMRSGKQQDSAGTGHPASFKSPGRPPSEGLQHRVAERRQAGLQPKQGIGGEPEVGHKPSSAGVLSATPITTSMERQQRQHATHTMQRRSFDLVKTVDNIEAAAAGSVDRHVSEEDEDDSSPQGGAQAGAAPATGDARKRRGASNISCSIRITSQSSFWTVEDAKVEVVLGQLPPLLAQEQGTAKYTGLVIGRSVLDSMESSDAGVPVSPDFSRVTAILRERAFGGKKELPRLLDTLVKGRMYVMIEQGGHRMCLAPVLRRQEDDKELVDYTSLALGMQHEELWARVYDDRLGVFSYLKPGEQPASKLAEAEAAATSTLMPAPRPWNPQAPPERSALRQSMSRAVAGQQAQAATLRPAERAITLPAAVSTQPANNSFMDDDDGLFDHDEHVDAANAGVFGVGMATQAPSLAGFGVGNGVLGVGIGDGRTGAYAGRGFTAGMDLLAHEVADTSFMEHDAYDEDASAFELQPQSSDPLAQQVGESYNPPVGPAWQQPQPAINPAAVGNGTVVGSARSSEARQMSVRFVDATGEVIGAADQKQTADLAPPPPGQEPLAQQPSFEKQSSQLGSIIVRVIQLQTPCKLLLPSLSGLCSFINGSGIKGIRLHLDTSLTQHAKDKASELTTYLREQGAVVTDCVPAPAAGTRKVQVMLVSKRWVLKHGLEGGSAQFRLIEYLVNGTHVMTEAFVDALKAGKLVLEDLLKDKAHVQVFAEGVHLLWDVTLLRGSTSTELEELVLALQEAGARLGGGRQNRQLFKAWVMAKDKADAPEHFSHLNKWSDSKIVDNLPQAYISSSNEVVKTAAKAIYVMNKEVIPLRYMMVVVPDLGTPTAQQKLTEQDWSYIGQVLAAANSQKTICAATRTQAIQFLSLLR